MSSFFEISLLCVCAGTVTKPRLSRLPQWGRSFSGNKCLTTYLTTFEDIVRVRPYITRLVAGVVTNMVPRRGLEQFRLG